MESIQGRPARREAAENIRGQMVSVCHRWSNISAVGWTGSPRCIGHRHGVRHHHHWIHLKGKFLRAPFDTAEHGPMRREVARSGLRGVRVGEASHPGLASRLQSKGSEFDQNLEVVIQHIAPNLMGTHVRISMQVWHCGNVFCKHCIVFVCSE